MGLDITVYPYVRQVEPPDYANKPGVNEWEVMSELGAVRAYVLDKSMRRSLAGLKEGRYYREERGFEPWDFYAGSYGGYNVRRGALGVAVGLPDEGRRTSVAARDVDCPLRELLWFGDNEGTIGGEACAEMVRDLDGDPGIRSRFIEVARGYARGRERDDAAAVVTAWTEWFDQWEKAIRDAAPGGMLHFY